MNESGGVNHRASKRERSRALLAVVMAGVALVGAPGAWAQSSILLNGSFEQGDASQGWFGISNWTSGEQWGGMLSGTNGAHDGTNSMRMFAFGSSIHLLEQRRPATATLVYEADGWLRAGDGAQAFHPTNGYCEVLLQFYNGSGSKVGGNCESLRFGSGGPTSWTRYTTGPCLAPAGAVTARVSCLYLAGGDQTTEGWVYYDDMKAYTSQPSRAGALTNPDFEVQPLGTLYDIPFWSGFGTADNGATVTNYRRNGRFAFRLGYTETLLGQTFAATAGAKYATSGYLFSPSGSDHFTTSTNCHGVILLQYLDATGTNVIQTFESAYFTPSSATNTWVYHEASGIAPVGTVSGRTMCAMLGSGAGLGGFIYFDDISQQAVATTSTVSGLLHNPGFDDGPTGNAYDLDQAANLPYWDWLGGTNAGYVTAGYKYDNAQSLAVTYPNNLAAQRAAAVTGRTYVLSGYISSPTNEKLANGAYGALLMEFYSTAFKAGTSVVSVVETAHFTSNNTAGAWHKFMVTNRAPWSGAVTARVLCAVQGSTQAYTGAVYFDGMTLAESNIPVANSKSGDVWNPGFEYTAAGTVLEAIDNWTALGNAGSVERTYARTGEKALKIYAPETLLGQSWVAAQGSRYSASAYAYTPAADRLQGATNLHAVVLLQYLNTTGGVVATYESSWFRTNTTAGTWSNLEVNGLAPVGTVTGRMLLALLGTNAGFGGTVWFDDISQSLMATGGTMAGVIHNGGFDDGTVGNAYYLSNDLPYWAWAGGTNAGFIVNNLSQTGGQSLAIVYPNNLLYQNFAAKTGYSYIVDGYLRTPGTDRMTSTTAYATFLLEFYNSKSGWQTSVSVVASAKLTNGSPADTWIKVSVTNRAPWSGPVTGRVSCALLDDVGTPYGGSVYFDSVSVTETNLPVSNTQAGQLWNPGFEYTAAGTKLPFLDNWTNFGTAGSVERTYRRSGENALRIYFPENYGVQFWTATQGNRYACSAYAYTPAADRFRSTTNTHGLLWLQFTDATGTNVLQTYESSWFTTNLPAGAWTNLAASGVAPAGTVYGRTVVGINGPTNGFGGTVWFDDASQSLLSSTGTISGKLRNPGFEDGPPGNAYDLDLSGDLPYWDWFGGTNAGFVATSYAYEGAQALTIVYPGNLCGQRFNATTGNSYIVEGRMYTPSGADKLAGQAYGVLYLEFYNGSFKNGTRVVSVVETPHFTTNFAAGTWHKFSVTNRAPWSGSITGRVLCAVMGSTQGYGGAVYFDGLTVIETNIPLSNTQSGSLWNRDFEYTADGTVLEQVDNWGALGNAGQVGSSFTRTGSRALRLYAPETMAAQSWTPTPGYRYSNTVWVATPAADRLLGATNLHAVLLMQFFNATGGLVTTYESPWFMTNNPAGAWTNLSVAGVAPYSAVTGRTVVGLLGTNLGFAGSVWFDDATHALAATGTSQAGMIYNGGFDDGLTGNAYYLSNDLPRWKWYGGTNAGFIVNNLSQSNGQSLAIVYPNNLLGQDFAAVTGRTYIVDGYIRTPGTDRMTGTTAYATFLLEFFNPKSGWVTSASVVASGYLTNGSPADTWVRFTVTNRAPWSGPVTGRVSCALLDLGGAPYGGSVYFDSIQVKETNIPISNVQSGSVWNPGFEYTANGTKLPYVDSWTNLGADAQVDSAYRRSGSQSLRFYFTETLAAQAWSATQGWRYTTSAYAFTPSDAEGSNLLVNGELTGSGTSPNSWNNWNDGNHDPDTGHYHSAPNSWEFWWASGVFQDVPGGFAVGDTLRFGGWFFMTTANALQGDKYGIVQLEFRSTSDTVIATATALPAVDAGSLKDAWFQSQGVATVPPGTAKIRTVVRCSVPTGGDGRFSADDIYVKRLAGPAKRFTTATNTHGVVVLQFLDASGTNVLAAHESAWFTPGTAADAWTLLSASGVAPFGTVYGRTLIGILGATNGFSGAIWFDDVGQSSSTGGTASGLLHNPGYEDGPSGNAYNLDLTGDLPYWDWYGGTNAGFIAAGYPYEGTQALAIVYPDNLCGQRAAVASGRTYTVSGYLSSPVGQKLSNSAYGVLYLEFYNGGFKNGTSLVSVVESPHFTSNYTAGSWHYFSVTNRAPWSGPITARVLCAVAGSTQGYGGAVYFDGLSMTESIIGLTNTQAGALWNPGFEYTAPGTVIEQIDSWTALGLAGQVSTTYKRSGQNALRIYAPETLAAQTWSATPGWKYSSSGYVMTPSAERLQGVSNLHAVVLLQFLNATNGVLVTYESPWFGTNSAADAWSGLEAIGVAPVGSVYGRTIAGLLGTNTGFGGAVYFDDLTQRVVSTSGTTSGLLHNPGFDDGPPGNAYDLWRTNDLPYWTWNGGPNAGFVARDHQKDGEQALVITYPQNGAGQDWAAASGKTYKAEGYLFTPSTAKFNTDGGSWGQLEMTFYVDGSTNPATEFSRTSVPFGASRPADQWIYFAVTGTAPAVGVVTGRLTCTIFSADPQGDFDLAGVIYFDQLSVVEYAATTSAWEQWQMDYFGTNSGPGVGLYDDYDEDGFPNFSEFTADTDPTDTSSVWNVTATRMTNNQFIVQWHSAAGRYYSLFRYTNLFNGPLALTNNMAATVPVNVYTDAVPVSVQQYYYRVSVTTNEP